MWAKIIIYTQLVLEFIIFIQTLLIIIGIVDILFEKSSTFVTPDLLNEYPELDVIIPIRYVDPNVLEKTLAGVKKQSYPQDKIHLYIADDTPDERKSKIYQKLSEKYNANYIYDPSNIKYKAGMLNIALKEAKSDFIAFFDFDQIPQQGILTHMISILQENPEKVFVQTKKTFRSLTNISRIWSALLYLQFFEVFERTKNKSNAVMFAGSTACFRRKYIDKIGGIPEVTFTEDNFITVKLLLEGHTGIFSDRVGSIGLVPNGYGAQISQLWRWSHGGSHTLKLNFIRLLKNKKITYSQKIEFISTLGITPILVLVYLYTISFLPLLMSGIDSPRYMIFNTSSIILVPLSVALTYILFASLAIWFDRNNPQSEFRFKHLPGFLVIAIASNFLIFTSGLAGMLGKLGPNSSRGQWNRYIPITRLGLLSFFLGIVLEYYSIVWLLSGLTAAILPLTIGLTLLPTIFIVIIYKKPVEISVD